MSISSNHEVAISISHVSRCIQIEWKCTAATNLATSVFGFCISICIYICICISICIFVCNFICICTELHSSYQFGNITTQLKPVWDNMWVARMPFSSSAAKNGSIGFFLGQKWADCGIVAKQCRLDLELEWSPNWGGPEKLTKYRYIYRYEYEYK